MKIIYSFQIQLKWHLKTKIQENIFIQTVTISSISCLEMYPLPSRSYMENAHLSFCSSLPLDVTERAHRNSRKSIVPSPLASKVRKTCSANLLASPYGKKLPYIFLNSSTDKCPLGQSFRKPLYHSCISASGTLNDRIHTWIWYMYQFEF